MTPSRKRHMIADPHVSPGAGDPDTKEEAVPMAGNHESDEPRSAGGHVGPHATEPMPNRFDPHVHGRSGGTGWLEVVAVVVMGLATIVAIWSAYEAVRWRSVANDTITAADARRAGGAGARPLLAAETQLDAETWIAWLRYRAAGDEEGMAFFQERFRDDFRPAFTAWMASAPAGELPPGTPFDLEEYAPLAEGAANGLSEATYALVEQAAVANRAADDFILVAAAMAAVVLLAGLGSKMQPSRIRESLVLGAALLLLGGIGYMLSLPLDARI